MSYERKFKLGDRVEFTHALYRRMGPGSERAWSTMEGFDNPRTGIVVGVRTLSNGRIVDHEYAVYGPTEYFSVYLVAYDLRRTPVYVKSEDLQPEGAGVTS